MVNLYPSLRSEVRKILGLEEGNQPFLHHFKDPDYGVIARHGHEYDKQNFAGTGLQEADYLAVPIGDVLTTEFAVKIPWKLEKKLKQKRFGQIDQQDKDSLIARFRDIDNVRPISKVYEFVRYSRRAEEVGSDLLAKAIDKTMVDVLKEFSKIDLRQFGFGDLESRVEKTALSWHWEWLPDTLMNTLHEGLLRALGAYESKKSDPTTDSLAKGAAFREIAWETNPDICYSVVYGHTHIPVEVPLAAKNDRDAFYVNTGTWRPFMVQTIPDVPNPGFVEVKNLTYAIFYNEEEDSSRKRKHTKSFELWTGSKKKYYS